MRPGSRIVSALGLALVLAVMWGAPRAHAEAPPAPPPAKRHNPLDGLEATGRIPRGRLPSDLSRPERWRYIPEGRIPPGDVFDRLFVTSFVAPVFFYDEEVGAGGGFALTDLDVWGSRRRDFLGLFLTYTTEGQQSYTAGWRHLLHHREVDGGGVIFEERSAIRATAGYERTLTRRFFGLGPTTDEDDETSYIDEQTFAGASISLALPDAGDDFVAQLGLRAEHRNLASGRVKSRPTTKEAFPELFHRGDSYDALYVEGGLRYDTRDSVFSPYRGFAVGVEAALAPAHSVGRVGLITRVFGTVVVPTPGLFHDDGTPDEENPPTDTLAFGASVAATEGRLPFFALPSLGGQDTLRGYVPNRFVGEAAWHAALEYRPWIVARGAALSDAIRIERLGVGLFVEVGAVARDLDRLFDSRVRLSAGPGLRVMVERTALFRADLGLSEEGANFTFTFGLSF